MRILSTLGLALCLATPAWADATRSHRLELNADPKGGFTVENLSGTMTIRSGSSGKVVVNATVHGEDQALVDSVRLVQDVGKDGRPRLLVKYPVDRHTAYRSPAQGAKGLGWLGAIFGNGSRMEYDGRRVSVGGSGVLLFAEVNIEVPSDVTAVFKNHVGPMSASGVRGDMRFDTGSGDVNVEDVRGRIVADTGSGDVRAKRIAGDFTCDTGSGDCLISDFDGDRLSCDTGSGDVRVESSRARRAKLDTGSGGVHLDADGLEDVVADTGSGDVELRIGGDAVRRIKADTGSGDVHLRLDPNASFEVHVDMGSGDIVNRYPDAQPIVRGREVKGYRRGDGRTVIDVDTGSGDLVLEPH